MTTLWLRNSLPLSKSSPVTSNGTVCTPAFNADRTCTSALLRTERVNTHPRCTDTNAHYGGSSLALQAATPCDTNADIDHSWATLPAGFADEVSSFKGANDCQVKLFENTNYGGTSLGP